MAKKLLVRTSLIILLGLFIGSTSCKKDNLETNDYLEEVVGDYMGFIVNTYWIDTIVGYGHDTMDVTLILTIAEPDSTVDIEFKPLYSSEDFSFKYVNEQFISTSEYHPPSLTLVNDSLYFKHKAGLGPIWTECFTKKTY